MTETSPFNSFTEIPAETLLQSIHFRLILNT
jgi:hypothetical protein